VRSHPEYQEQDVQGLPKSTITSTEMPEDDFVVIPQDLLRKYIAYARDRIQPRILQIDQDKVAQFFADLRRESFMGGSMPMNVRHIESILRMAEAHARMHLREFVRSEDVDFGIKVMLESFVSAQKMSVAKALHKRFLRYIQQPRDATKVLYQTLCLLAKEKMMMQQWLQHNLDTVCIPLQEFTSRVPEIYLADLQAFYSCKAFVSNGFALDAANQAITKQT